MGEPGADLVEGITPTPGAADPASTASAAALFLPCVEGETFSGVEGGAALGKFLVGRRFCEFGPSKTALDSWVARDMLPWAATGITQRVVAAGAGLGKRSSRVQIIGGKLFAKVSPTDQGQSRIWYWLWGLQELLDKHKVEVPDVDMAMQTQDSAQCPVRSKPPKDKRLAAKFQDFQPGAAWNAPPAVFSFVTTANNYDILWPLWTMWGEDVEGASAKTGGFHDPSWRHLHGSLIATARKNPWSARRAVRPYWRGSVKTFGMRGELVKCAARSKGPTDPDAANVQHKEKAGKAISAGDRAANKYLIYMDGKTASTGQLPMIPTGAVLLLHPTEYVTLHGRALKSTGHHAMFSLDNVCKSISDVVRMLNDDEEGTAKTAAALLEWSAEQLSQNSVERYMLAMLQAYAGLQKFKVARTAGTVAFNWSVIKKHVRRKH